MAQEIDMTRIPEHIAIIMDGNGRWAMDRGLDRTFGHKAGLDNLEAITTICSNLGVKYLTVYAFSIENFNRPAYEVEALMGLVLSFIKMDLFHNNNVSFHVVGDRERLPKSVQDKLRSMEEETAMYDGMAMTIAMGYSSKQEIVNATKKIALEVQSGKMSADDINEETISKHLWTAWMPDPDLLIRTGGEVRISNYLLWQCAYSEFYFCDTYWPDFGEEDLHKAIASYQRRQRRFGKTEEQVENEEKI
ncbi:MAG: isoprenyl transferase [Prevotella sp.]|jgi:undecaprenyl diphosphate synthase|nr:isoprenyl transferase [Prevotella sp.]